MDINSTFTTKSGRKVNVSLTIVGATLTGSATIDGKQAAVTGYAIVQGRKCLGISGAAPWLPIDDALYAKIDAAAREQYRAMNAEAVAIDEAGRLESAYRQLERDGAGNAELIAAQRAWQAALAKCPATEQVRYNETATNNPWTL